MASTKDGEDSKTIVLSEKNIFQHMKDFVNTWSKNPVSDEAVIVAKDIQYHDQDSNDSLMMLCPLAEESSYVFIKPYLDTGMDTVKYTLTVASINDLAWNETAGYYPFTTPYVNSERIKFSKRRTLLSEV